MTASTIARCLLPLCVAGVTAACSGTESSPKIPLGQVASADSARAVEAAHAIIGPAARAALDSGNMLFRQRAYAAALVHYRAASSLAPQHPAPFFGIYMVARAIHDSAMADSALTAIRVRNGPMTAAPHSRSDSALRRFHEMLQKKSTSE